MTQLREIAENHFTDDQNYEFMLINECVFVRYFDNLDLSIGGFNMMNEKVADHIGDGNFYVFAVFDTTFGDMDPEVKKKLARNDGFFAQREFELLVMPNLGLRLLFNAYKMVNKPKHLIKVVKSIDAALEYLEEKGKSTAEIRAKIPSIIEN